MRSVSSKGLSLLPNSESTLQPLADVLQASPESDALVILGRLLDSLPIGFHVSDCDGAYHILYANRVWERWLGREKLPVAGKTLEELFPGAGKAGVLDLMREVCAKPSELAARLLIAIVEELREEQQTVQSLCD